MTKEEWIEDLDYFIQQLEKIHPNPYKNFNKEEFYKKLEELKNINDKLTIDNMGRNICYLVALLKDAHTYLGPTDKEIPLSFRIINDKLYIVNTNEINKKALFKEVIFINNIPIKDIINELKKFISYETEAYKYLKLSEIFSSPHFLKKIGVIDSDIYNVIYNSIGEVNNIQFDLNEKEIITDMIFNQEESYYNLNYIREQNTLYIKYRSCKEDENYKMEEMLNDVEEILENDVKKVVVDIRHNMGGNSQIIKPLISRLEEYKKEGGEILCLIDEGTFSSGMHALVDLKRIGAVFFGSNTGGSKEERFGEVVKIALPNSKIEFSCSTKTYKPIDNDSSVGENKSGQKSFIPDYEIYISIEDLRIGKDPVMEASLEYGHDKHK